MALINNVKFNKPDPRKNYANKAFDYHNQIAIVDYFDVVKTGFEDEFDFLKVLRHSGGGTKFSDLLTINYEWVLRRQWKKYKDSPNSPYTLAARPSGGKRSKVLELRVIDRYGVSTGPLAYTDYNYFFHVYKSRFEIIVYKGREIKILEYFGFKGADKKYKDKEITIQLNSLRSGAIDVV